MCCYVPKEAVLHSRRLHRPGALLVRQPLPADVAASRALRRRAGEVARGRPHADQVGSAGGTSPERSSPRASARPSVPDPTLVRGGASKRERHSDGLVRVRGTLPVRGSTHASRASVVLCQSGRVRCVPSRTDCNFQSQAALPTPRSSTRALSRSPRRFSTRSDLSRAKSPVSYNYIENGRAESMCAA